MSDYLALTNNVLARIQEFQRNHEIEIPENYSPENALKSALLIFAENAALQRCTSTSVYNALLDMVVQGLSPAKKQCYFIPRGNKCAFQRSYFGTVSVAKRLAGIKDVEAQEVYKDDVFAYHIEDGNPIIDEHKQSLDTRGGEWVGGYAVVTKADDTKHCVIMTRKEILAAWDKSSSTQRATHNQFPSEMIKRTLVNRACKLLINSTDDSDLLVGAINRSTEAEYDASPKRQSAGFLTEEAAAGAEVIEVGDGAEDTVEAQDGE
jgi:recombination protein RecT